MLSYEWKERCTQLYETYIPALTPVVDVVSRSIEKAYVVMQKKQQKLRLQIKAIEDIPKEQNKLSLLQLEAHQVQRQRLHRANTSGKSWLHKDEPLGWFKEHSKHPMYGRLCPALVCTQTRLCKEVREIETTHARFTFDLSSRSPSMLPEDMWRLVFEYLTDEPILVLSQTSCHLYNIVTSFDLYPVLQYGNKLRHMAVMKKQHDYPLLSKLIVTYSDYKHQCHVVNRLQNQVEDMNRQGQRLLEEIKEKAQTFLPIARAERESVLIPYLREQDERLLFEFAIDSMGTSHGSSQIQALPPRAFWEGSKNRKTLRRQFTDCNTSMSSFFHAPGIHLLRELHMAQDDLVDGRKTLARAMRRLEGEFLKTIHTVLEQVRDCPLLSSEFNCCFDELGQDNECVMTTEELGLFLDPLITDAECGTSVWEAVYKAVESMYSHLMVLIPCIPSTIVRDMMRVVHVDQTGRNILGDWFQYLNYLSQRRNCFEIGLRLVTSKEEDTESGLLLRFSRPADEHEGNLNALIPFCYLSVTRYENRSAKSLVNTCDVVIIWPSHSTCEVLLKSVFDRGAFVTETFAALTSHSVESSLQTHALLTNRCAPCGRELKTHSFLGPRCLNYYYKSQIQT